MRWANWSGGSVEVARSDSENAAIGAANGRRRGSLLIVNGSVSAQAAVYGPGIGTGKDSTISRLTIVSGNIAPSSTVTAYPVFVSGSGIGTGQASTITRLAIARGTITASCSGNNASVFGIGTGRNSEITNLAIRSGNITVSCSGSPASGSGIGSYPIFGHGDGLSGLLVSCDASREFNEKHGVSGTEKHSAEY
jgi:hypothetical protein